MDLQQPNQTLANIAEDLAQLAERAGPVLKQPMKTEREALSTQLCAIHDLLVEANRRLRELQGKYPEYFQM